MTLGASVLIHSEALVTKLTQDRIAPNYVGVRCVRASDAGQKTSQNRVTQSSITYKVTDDQGNERRMTHQEKKAFKKQMALERKNAKKRKAEDRTESASGSRDDSKEQSEPTDEQQEQQQGDSKYHMLSVDATAIEEEVLENNEKRKRPCPVLLSPPMALQAYHVLESAPPSITNDNTSAQHQYFVQYDADLSKQWAEQLKASMLPAETVRQAENMRPMAYQLTPEPWSRMRPTTAMDTQPHSMTTSSALYPGTFQENSDTTNTSSNTNTIHSADWMNVTCRPPDELDWTKALVFDYLYRHSEFHVSCGAKFGSDLLIYDGPREKRHAFAGLRVLVSNTPTTATEENALPLPSAYAMAGFVRGLNTAGKLALLATVLESKEGDKTTYRLAFVDVALEKILTAPTHRRNARTEKRRDMTQKLAKT